MSVIKCCGFCQKTHAFICDAPEGFVYQRIDYLVFCKVCKNTVMQVTRVDENGKISTFRRTNERARELFDRLRTSILFKLDAPMPLRGGSSFYLRYSEFGRVKRCYSNFSALKPVGESLDLPGRNRVKLPKLPRQLKLL